MRLVFTFFLISGFSSLVYEIVWLRLAMAAFGVNAPLVSTFLSVFMAGLGLGSLAAGLLAKKFTARGLGFFLRLYALLELLLAVSALLVPYLINQAQSMLAHTFAGVSWGSLGYYAVSGFLLTGILLPWCVCMGATIPLAMAALRKFNVAASRRSFSFLYLANVIGASAGTLISAFVMIELLGLKGTLAVTAITNFLIAATAFAYSYFKAGPAPAVAAAPKGAARPAKPAEPSLYPLVMLFTTGLVSMALEIVWIRIYLRLFDTTVYTFALILFIYLLATALGSVSYRLFVKSLKSVYEGVLWSLAGLLGLLSVFALFRGSPATPFKTVNLELLSLGIMPFCFLIGFLTPMLVDRWTEGDPHQAGKAYAVNIIGCIIGPLLAGFVILVRFSEFAALALLALPLFMAGLAVVFRPRPKENYGWGLRIPRGLATGLTLGAVVLMVYAGTQQRGRENEVVKRDYEAVVKATGQGLKKRLYVNTIAVTELTPITKMMAHLPLAFSPSKPQNSLVIAFGMGTTFRSCLSWGIPATAVDLIPSVPEFFEYFHPDAAEIRQSPGAEIVIDDGRRFMKRITQRYDVIAIDPPPPVEAAYSGLLYSKEFYEIARARLKPEGVLQQWLPWGDRATVAAVAKALYESFPHVRVFSSVEGWGFHFLAANRPLPLRNAADLAALLPPAAKADLVAWGPFSTPEAQFQKVLDKEVPIDKFISLDAQIPALTDNTPVNEYFQLRRFFDHSQKVLDKF
jgi:predicted membrane-bound spermidine synthase